jgi:hypothetical protein
MALTHEPHTTGQSNSSWRPPERVRLVVPRSGLSMIRLFQPAFLGLREDESESEVVRERTRLSPPHSTASLIFSGSLFRLDFRLARCL